jgi:protocatechuate 3,4-dioxygenase beta subunit
MKRFVLATMTILLIAPLAWGQNHGTISGTVFAENDGGNVPLGSAIVAAFLVDSHFPIGADITDDDGNYEIEVPFGEYHVRAHAWNFVGEWYDNVYHRSDATPVAVTEEQNAEDIDFILADYDQQETGTISGIITDASTDDPIEGAYVVAQGSNPMNTRHGVSAEDGSYTIEGLHSDSYTVIAHKEDYFPNQYPDEVVVDGDDITDINIALTPRVPTGMTGMVTDADSGEPIAGAHVVAIDVNHHHRHGWAETGEDGTYVLEIRPGEYTVQAGAWGYLPQEYPENVIVTEDGFTENIDFALAGFDFGSISGTVTDTDANPIPMAVVTLRAVDGFHWRHTRTDENGDYMFDDVIPGEYRVRAFQFGFEPGEYPDPVMVEDGQDVTGIDIVLTPYEPPFDGYIAGTVTDDETGDPLADAVVVGFGVHVGPWGPRWIVRRTYTGEDGTYSLGNLPEVPFRIVAWAEGYVGEFYDDVRHFWEATPVTPNADGIDMALSPRSDGIRSIAGRITVQGQNMDVESIVYATVEGQIVDVGLADMDGYYSLTGLEGDVYEISAFSIRGEGSYDSPVDVTFGDFYGADIVLSPTSTDDSDQLPTRSSLSQNYPNPFNAQTMISFTLTEPADVTLEVFNIVGQRVAVIADGSYQTGTFDVIWDGLDKNGQPVASGVYYYRLRADDYTETRRMTLLK